MSFNEDMKKRSENGFSHIKVRLETADKNYLMSKVGLDGDYLTVREYIRALILRDREEIIYR